MLSPHERARMAAQIRAARAILDWSQTRLAGETGLTQRSIHRLEHGASEVRRSTASSLHKVFDQTGVRIEETDDGGFRISVPGEVLEQVSSPKAR